MLLLDEFPTEANSNTFWQFMKQNRLNFDKAKSTLKILPSHQA